MKDETLLPDVASLEKVLEWVAGLPVPTKSATANYCRLKNFIIDYNAAIQSGNSGQINLANSFTDDELMGIAHGDNPVANAYRELLEFRRNAAGGNSGQPVTVPDESWRTEAEKQAEIYGQSFVVFRNGEQPQCADRKSVV